jgi:hypothetical protein
MESVRRPNKKAVEAELERRGFLILDSGPRKTVLGEDQPQIFDLICFANEFTDDLVLDKPFRSWTAVNFRANGFSRSEMRAVASNRGGRVLFATNRAGHLRLEP